MSTGNLLKTPLHDWHVERGARMVDFAGWSMPVQYDSIVTEHVATRERASVFDVSHMGRLRFDGPGSGSFLDRLLTRRVLGLKPGCIRYALVANNEGGILDDVLVYHQQTPSGTDYHMLVVNAGNRARIVQWIQSQLQPDDEVLMSDRTEETAMLAIQGPRAIELVNPLLNADVPAMGYYRSKTTKQMGKVCIVSRTGYTGEDGVELIMRREDAPLILENLFRAGRECNLVPAGLGARDTLRMEAAMPLYGHELDETINPFEAGLRFAVNFTDSSGQPRRFVGREALQPLADQPSRVSRVGLLLEGKRAAREKYPVFDGETQVGEVSSGSFSPTLQRPIAMAYIDAADAKLLEAGRSLEVDIRGRRHPAEITSLPFYSRP
ncbi:MAG: glycine cleavage system aminomethyltransferase GcvT [Pirellulaceae bacterium]